MVLSYDGFCLSQRGEPPLNLKMFISSNAFDNSTFFYEQLKFIWLSGVVRAIEVGGEINASSRDPIPLYNTLRRISPAPPAFQICNVFNVYQRVSHLALLVHYRSRTALET